MEYVILFSLAALGVAVVALTITSRASDSSVPGSSKSQNDLAGTISDSELEAQLRILVDSRKYIEAIKLIRLHKKDIGLKEAKEIVDELARGGELKLPNRRPSSEKASIELAGQGTEHILALLREGRKIEAIKELREQTGLGLKESKDEIDRLERGL
jgi:ribosomal protein L7/L12